MVVSPAFAVSAVPAAASPGVSVVAVRASDPTAEFAAVVCAAPPVACGHQRRAVVVSAAADALVRRVVFPGLAAGGADRAVAGASVPARDGRERRWAAARLGGGLSYCARHSQLDSPACLFPSGSREDGLSP